MLLAFLLSTACAESQPRDAAPDALVDVTDGRAEPGGYQDHSAWLSHPGVDEAVRSATAHWRDADELFRADTPLILDVAKGSFTRAGSEQYAVLYRLNSIPRCCPRGGLAVVEGDVLVRHIAHPGAGSELSAVTDLLDGGRDLLVQTGGFVMGGFLEQGVSLLAFEADGRVRDFGSITTLVYGCESGSPTASHVLATRLRARSGPDGPTFFAQTFRSPCDDTWRALGPEEEVTLSLYDEDGYTDLPVR